MRINLIQASSPDNEDITTRRARIADMVLSTRGDLVVLPELWPVGYNNFDQYAETAEPMNGATITDASVWARTLGSYVHVGSFVEDAGDGKFHNTTALINPDGELIHSYRKMHVFGYKSLEAELLAPGESITATTWPFGEVGSTTCYDLRFPELWRGLVDEGAETVITPAAWPQARLAHWRLFTSARAVENQMLIIACNAAGEQRGVTLAGHSRVIDPWGNVLLEADDAEGIFSIDVDPDIVRQVRAEFPVLGDRKLTFGPRPTERPA
ncbi:carbon-nitrogen family hydrolase [Microbacterium sp. SSW1-49]|uniref:Carbon-nitrogen family hydrolase n=1 Tax=Microbacterium croceum TaxID=2851645 RepID=A0ABT0FCD2_9MICO|nr:carbon-nitrogen family hydrolase [Microbacterium croceum]MCK2035722.1 carbon-nitrogen family hydrolase [Microbacterium croceum]